MLCFFASVEVRAAVCTDSVHALATYIEAKRQPNAFGNFDRGRRLSGGDREGAWGATNVSGKVFYHPRTNRPLNDLVLKDLTFFKAPRPGMVQRIRDLFFGRRSDEVDIEIYNQIYEIIRLQNAGRFPVVVNWGIEEFTGARNGYRLRMIMENFRDGQAPFTQRAETSNLRAFRSYPDLAKISILESMQNILGLHHDGHLGNGYVRGKKVGDEVVGLDFGVIDVTSMWTNAEALASWRKFQEDLAIYGHEDSQKVHLYYIWSDTIRHDISYFQKRKLMSEDLWPELQQLRTNGIESFPEEERPRVLEIQSQVNALTPDYIFRTGSFGED